MGSQRQRVRRVAAARRASGSEESPLRSDPQGYERYSHLLCLRASSHAGCIRDGSVSSAGSWGSDARVRQGESFFLALFSSLLEAFTLKLPSDARTSLSIPQCRTVRYCSKGQSLVGSLGLPKLILPFFSLSRLADHQRLDWKAKHKLLCIKPIWLEIS